MIVLYFKLNNLYNIYIHVYNKYVYVYNKEIGEIKLFLNEVTSK